MNFKEILELIDKVADRGIAVVEVERREAGCEAGQRDAARG